MWKLIGPIAALMLMAGQAHANPSTVNAWKTDTLELGDKVVEWVSSSADANLDAAGVFLGGPYSFNLSGVGTVNENFSMEFKVYITDLNFQFDMYGVSMNDHLFNTRPRPA